MQASKQANYIPRSKNLRGFSLIELMVVISIISLLTITSIPSFNRFKIKAARVEAKQNINALYTLVQSFHAEHSAYAPPATWYPLGDYYGEYFFHSLSPDWGSVGNATCSESDSYPNIYGFRVSDCRKLRYNYHVDATTGDGGTDFSLKSYFTITALAFYYVKDDHKLVTGQGPPTRSCKIPLPTMSLYFLDKLAMYETGRQAILVDGLKNCN